MQPQIQTQLAALKYLLSFVTFQVPSSFTCAVPPNSLHPAGGHREWRNSELLLLELHQVPLTHGVLSWGLCTWYSLGMACPSPLPQTIFQLTLFLPSVLNCEFLREVSSDHSIHLFHGIMLPKHLSLLHCMYFFNKYLSSNRLQLPSVQRPYLTLHTIISLVPSIVPGTYQVLSKYLLSE